MDWAGVLASESAEEEEMSMLAIRFTARMLKRTVDSEDDPASESDGKRPRRSSLDEGGKKEWAIILVDSLDQATNDQPVLEGAPNGVNKHLEEGILVGGPNVDETGEGSPSGVVVALLPPSKPTYIVSSRRRPPN